MISITTAELNTLLAAFLWPLSRILALVATAPLLGNPSVPVRIKLGLAVMITVLVMPLVEKSLPQIDPASGVGFAILLQQILIGIAMGLVMRVVFVAVEMAGELIGLQMGLGFAVFFDPQNSGQIDIVGRFLGVIASLAFLAIDGHLIMIALISQSFSTLPIGLEGMTNATFTTLANWGSEIFKSGLQLSLPVLTALLITNLALGVLTRVAPQLNIFAVGFPLTLSIGLLVMALSMPFYAPILKHLVQDGLNLMMGILNVNKINMP
ncbi:flagellar biosynthetic protein FliR [Nitrosomonas oligotropha]|uniref:Flagellar biosynthetic protein FliR n=1 Tax=Nitrosomonas oligotropha TaxID=42354 RepID=A0A1H8L2L3_9PROT|nr:flagellar biosynthetic protein FliR [Nitrosomonas oligotropha]SDW17461.1 flagellar biosynthetic protein FliR [Nitrosomonas oligotropha]SEN98888.1 flagellar biosynthetic protein FliR [Nitrosomonas oligotropha]